VAQSALEGLRALLDDLLPLALPVSDPAFLLVVVANDEAVEQSVNQLLNLGSRQGGHHGNTSAVAVPLVREGALVCSIVLGRSLVDPLQPELFHLPETVSSVLEELLHVRLYTLRWAQTGSASVPASDSPPAAVRICASRAFDEFIVAALKAQMMGTLPLVDNEGGLSVSHPQYGGLAGRMLDELGERLPAMVDAAATSPDYVAAWHEVMDAVYRLCFEPLARTAGFRQGAQSEPIRWPGDDPAESLFYRVYVAVDWHRCLAAMQQSLQDGLANMERAIETVGLAVTDFLARVGVTFELRDDGWRVYFDPDAS
jgi:hypothetical protein